MLQRQNAMLPDFVYNYLLELTCEATLEYDSDTESTCNTEWDIEKGTI